MDTLHQKTFLGKSDMQEVGRGNQFYFETVLIPDGQFVIKHSKASFGDTERVDTTDNLLDNEFKSSKINHYRDELPSIPSHGFSSYESSLEKLSGNSDQDNFLDKEELFWVVKKSGHSNYDFLSKDSQVNFQISPIPSSFDNEILKLRNINSSFQRGKDASFEESVTSLIPGNEDKSVKESLNAANDKVNKPFSDTIQHVGLKVKKGSAHDSIQQDNIGMQTKFVSDTVQCDESKAKKEFFPGFQRNRNKEKKKGFLDTVQSNKNKERKKCFPDTVQSNREKKKKESKKSSGKRDKETEKVFPDTVEANKQVLGTVNNSSSSKTIGYVPIKTNYCDLPSSPKTQQNLNITTNLDSIGMPKEFNIDFLKKCIIKASRSLIEAEKSLRVLGKLLRSEISMEKKTAMKHMKYFRCTIGTFRRTVNGIDQNLLNHYNYLIPNNINNIDSESIPKSISNIDLGEKTRGNLFEILSPSIATRTSQEETPVDRRENTNFESSVTNCELKVQSKHKKRKRDDDCPRTGKKHKNRRSSFSSERTVECKRFNSIQSIENKPLNKGSFEPIIILD